MPQLVHVVPRLLARHPARLARVAGDLSVERHGVLHDHERAPGLYVVEEDLVEGAALVFEHVLGDLDARVAQDLEPLARDERVGVARADDHAREAGGDERVGTRRLLAVVAAGLERDIDGGALRGLGTAGQRVALGVQVADLVVVAGRDDASVADYDRAHHGVGGDVPTALFRKLECAPHVVFVVHGTLVQVALASGATSEGACARQKTKNLEQRRLFQGTSPGARAAHQRDSSLIQTILSASEFHRTGSADAEFAGCDRRWGIAPRPEDPIFVRTYLYAPAWPASREPARIAAILQPRYPTAERVARRKRER